MDSRDEQSLRAAKMYYRDNLSQAEVALALGISRPTTSKLIQHAHDRGFVTITIRDPREASSTTATALATKYGLTSVRKPSVLLSSMGPVSVCRGGEQCIPSPSISLKKTFTT